MLRRQVVILCIHGTQPPKFGHEIYVILTNDNTAAHANARSDFVVVVVVVVVNQIG